jgi:hypothetical protein
VQAWLGAIHFLLGAADSCATKKTFREYYLVVTQKLVFEELITENISHKFQVTI